MSKVDPFSLEALIAWLEKQPGEMEYPHMDVRGCALCQYGTSIGRGNIFHDLLDEFEARGHWKDVAHITLLPPHTFGAALQRARSLQANEREGNCG